MSPLTAMRAWLAEPVPHGERNDYRLGVSTPAADWRRATRLETWCRSALRRAPSPEKWRYSFGLRDARDLLLPDLLCIGAHKAATSWLHAALARHPDAFVPAGPKETHYFDFLFHEPLARYAGLFAAGRQRVKCDVTPNYGRLRPARIRFVRRVMPEARLVFLLRNPVERAWSHAVMDLATRSGRRVADVSDDEWFAHLRSPASVRSGHYTAMLDAWLRHFPEERLFVGFFEDVMRRPRGLLAEIFIHAGLDPRAEGALAAAGEPVAAGPGIAMPAHLREAIIPLYAREMRHIAARYGGPARRWGAGT